METQIVELEDVSVQHELAQKLKFKELQGHIRYYIYDMIQCLDGAKELFHIS
jgi:hypothetical protein